MNLNFPVKYAVLKIQRQRAYNSDIETIGYVPAKCCLINEIKRHYADGKSKMFYEVVFSWNSRSYNERNIDAIRSREVIFPEFNANDQCWNASIVDAVYDDLQKCQQQADKLNKEQQYEGTKYLKADDNFSKNVKEIIDAYNVELKKVQEFATERLQDNLNPELPDQFAMQ